jgi:hypothetical protein
VKGSARAFILRERERERERESREVGEEVNIDNQSKILIVY